MKLQALLRALPAYQVQNQRDIEISSITADSRLVIPGALFVVYLGVNVDGARFALRANVVKWLK